MNNLKKRLLAALLSFVMVFLSMGEFFTVYAGPPGIVNDPDIIAEVTYDRSVVNSRGNSDFYVGEEVSFYANITVSSITRSIPGAYGKLYLPKKIFPTVNATNISTWINRPSNNYLNIDSSSDTEYHIVKLKFNNLGGGTTQTVPFKGKIADFSLANNESYVIPYQVYDANDTLLESTNNTFTAKTYPIGYGSEDYNYRRSYQYVQGSSDLQSDHSLSNTLSTYVAFYTRRTNWPAPGTYHGTQFPQVGADRRKTRVTVQLPANENFDTTDSRNAGWTYDPVNHTISKEKNYPSNTYTSESFYIRYNNQPTGTLNAPVEVTFPITWAYVNDDGSIDQASVEKSKTFVRYASYPPVPATDRGITVYKNASPYVYTFDDREESTIHKYDITTNWSWYVGAPATNPVLGQKKGRLLSLLDTPEVDMEFVGYQIKYGNTTGKVSDAAGTEQTVPVLNDTQKAALSNNQLIGTKPDGSEEVIATNISITENSTMIDLPNPTHYTKINLKFTNPIEIQAPNANVLTATYKFRLAENAYNDVKAILDTKPDNEQGYTDTYNRANTFGDDGAGHQWTPQSRHLIRWVKIYAKENAHTTQNQNLGTKYLGEEFAMTDGIQFRYNLPERGRDVKNPKFFMLTDPALEFKGMTTNSFGQATFGPHMNNYRVEYNFKNTGKTAYIWDFPTFHLPKGNNYYTIGLYPRFKTTKNMAGGQNSIDTYMSWDNNEEATTDKVPGLYDDVLDLDNDGNTTEKFSSKKATYLYSPPLELILTKRSKRADSAETLYSTLTTPDSEQIVDYKLNIFNNSITGVSGFTFFDILPHVGDKAIAPDQQGHYADRGSTYRLGLTGPLDPHPNYTYEYSTTPVTEGNIAANYAGATWTSSVSDWSAVTMFRLKMKPGYTLASGSSDDITFRAKMPDTTPLDTTNKAVNTFAGFAGDSYTGAFEALSNVVVPKKYKISGKIYYDVPPAGGSGNGTYLTTDDDVPAAGRTVSLYDASGNPVLDESGNPMTTTANANGDYVFDNISKAGTYKVVITPGVGDTISPNRVTSTSLIIGNDFADGTQGSNPVFETSVTLTPSDDKKTANAALVASNSTLKVKYVDMAGNPIPLDDGSGNVADTDSVHGFRAPYTVTPPATLTGVANYEYAEPDLTNGRPLTGTLNPGQNVVVLKYKRKTAGNITVNHYEVGGSTQLYTPAGAASPSAESYVGTEKLGLTENLTNKEADIDNFEYVSTDVTGAPSATSPTATGDTTVTYRTAPQTVTYRYKRKDAANITVNHYEVGGSTQLYTPAGATAPSAETISGAGKLGTTQSLTNKEANIANFEYVSTDVTGASSATTPTSTGATTLTHGTSPQTVTYYYKRKNAGDVIVHHVELGTTTQLVPDVTLNGTNKLGLPYNTTNLSIPNFDVVTPLPTNQNGTYTTGTQHVTYYYKRKDAGDVIVNHYEVGGNTQLYKPVGSANAAAENYPGAGKLGLTQNLTNKAADIANFEYVSVEITGAPSATAPGATGDTTVTYQTGTQTVTYRYKRKNAGNITVNHYEVGGSTQLYTPSGAAAPSAQTFSGTGKLGLSENLTNKAADIANYEYVSVDVTGASGASTPTTVGATDVTYQTGNQVVTYRYKRKDAANITVHHYIDGTTTELYTPAGAASPGPETISGSGKLGLTENLTNKEADIANYEFVGVDVSGAASATTPSATGATTLTHGNTAQTVIYKYRRKNAGNIIVNHVEVGGSTQLYTPAGAASPSAQTFDGSGKLGLVENLTNKEADIANYEFVNVEITAAPGASTPTATGATGVTYRAGTQTVTYRYRRKDAANITVHHVEDGTSTELYTPAGAAAPSAETISGAGKLGTTENLNNRAADIANFDYVGIDVSGAPSATSPSSTGATTLTHGNNAQTVTYKYRRKDAGNVIVNYVEQGSNIPLKSPDTLNGSGKLGLSYTTTPQNFNNYELVSATPANHSGNYPPAGNDITVTYVYRRKNAGNITVNHFEVGTTNQLYKPLGAAAPSAETFNGTGKLGLSEDLTNKEAAIANYEYVSVDVSGAGGANTPNASGDTTVTYIAGNQVVNYYYKRKDASNITIHHVEDGTNTELYTPAGAAGPSPEVISGSGKLGTTENLNNRATDIANFEYVGIDVSGAPSATTPSANGATTLTHGNAPQTVIYKYRRKDVGNVLVHHYEAGTTTSVSPDENLSGVGKSGLTYNTSPATVANYTVVSSTPTNHTGTYPNSGTTVVTYEYRRNDAGNVIVHHYEDGTTTPLVPDTTLNGSGKLGLPYSTTEHNIPNFTLVAQPSNKNGTYTTGNQEVTYLYRRNDAGNVLVHHYEVGTTTSVSPDENLSGAGKSGLIYNTSPATVANYTVVSSTPTNHTGTYPNSGTTVVTYEYRRNDAGNVIVHHYEDGTTTPLVPDTTLNGSGKLGLPYSTTEHNIPNFTLVAQPSNKNGTYTSGNQEVTYFYRRNDAGNVLVHHYEAGTTTSVSPDVNLSGAGKSGLTYNTSPETIANFTVVNATPTDHTGTYPSSGTTVVTYEYVRNDAQSVTVKYVEQGSGTPLDTDDVMGGAGKLGLPYTTTEKNIPNYELVAQPVNKNGTYTNTPQTVIYEYRRMPGGDVTSIYVDEDGNEIDIPETQSGTGKLGLPYTTTSKTIPNFTLVSIPTNANGTFIPGPQTVTYVYRRADAGDVTVYHKSVYDNSDLSTPTVLDGSRKLGLPYTTSPETYSDYEIDTIPGNANGTYVSGSRSVTYLYKRKQSGGVVVNYLDNNGNRIETPDTITGSDNVGLPYTTTPKTIPNYRLITVPPNANGVFTVPPITVNYIYKREDAGDVIIEHIDENGNVPLETPEVLDGSEKLGESYTTSSKVFENYDLISVPSNANGVFTSGSQTVTYVYRRKDAGDVIAHYVDTAGLAIESDEILDGSRSLGLPYETASKEIAGYTLLLVRGSETGVFSPGRIEVTYIYKKNPGQVIIPQPVIPVTPVTPGSITPISPVTPGGVTPVTPEGSIPSRIATPSQINRPGDRYQDLVIRPTATPSIATSSNGSRGGSTGGSSTVRPEKVNTVTDGQSKSAKELILIDNATPSREPQKSDYKKETNETTSATSATRIGLSVPKTEDTKDMRGYIFALITSLAAAMALALKKKEDR